MNKNILVLQTQAPYGSSLARDGLDYVLTSAAYDQNISIVFMNDGVWQLKQNQAPSAIQQKSQLGAIEVLSLYGVESLFVCREDLTERGLPADNLPDNVSLIERSDIRTLMDAQDSIIRF